MKTTITDRNSKLGKIPNISLPPVKACRPDAPCKKECYALKSFRMYPNVKSAWAGNLEMVQNNPERYFQDIRDFLSKKRKPARFFRWHVSGDILSNDYLINMIQIAKDNPKTIFLAFTKQYEIINNAIDFGSSIPENLTIIFSAWSGFSLDNPYGFPVAWYQDGNENRVPSDALECPGHCESCGMCFQLPKIGKDVVFHKH